jgi:hypothetical protein
MDVEALNRECSVRVLAFTSQGPAGKFFVPLYWVYWEPKHADRIGCAAEVEFLAPTRTIRQLHVNNEAFILRKPLTVGNIDKVLSDTNIPANNRRH